MVDNHLVLTILLVKTVRNGSGRGLLDDMENLEGDNHICILRRLVLRVYAAVCLWTAGASLTRTFDQIVQA